MNRDEFDTPTLSRCYVDDDKQRCGFSAGTRVGDFINCVHGSQAARRSSSEACRRRHTTNGWHPSSATNHSACGLGRVRFQLWTAATKHLAFIFNHTSLSTNIVAGRQKPNLMTHTQSQYTVDTDMEGKYHPTTGVKKRHKKKIEKKRHICCTKQRDVLDEVLARPLWCSSLRPVSAFSAIYSFSCEILFFSGFFLVQRAAKANKG